MQTSRCVQNNRCVHRARGAAWDDGHWVYSIDYTSTGSSAQHSAGVGADEQVCVRVCGVKSGCVAPNWNDHMREGALGVQRIPENSSGPEGMQCGHQAGQLYVTNGGGCRKEAGLQGLVGWSPVRVVWPSGLRACSETTSQTILMSKMVGAAG